MQVCDFLSSPPSINLSNRKKGKSKLSGFLSIILCLMIIATSIYYFYIYLYKKEFTIKYSTKNFLSLSKYERNKIKKEVPIEMFISVENPNIFANLIIYHNDNESDFDAYPDNNISRCNDNLEIDPQGTFYCFNATERTQFVMFCIDNCTDSEGNDIIIRPTVYTKSLIIQHNESNPFKTNVENKLHTFYPININSLTIVIYSYTPVIYKTSNILNRDDETFYSS